MFISLLVLAHTRSNEQPHKPHVQIQLNVHKLLPPRHLLVPTLHPHLMAKMPSPCVSSKFVTFSRKYGRLNSMCDSLILQQQKCNTMCRDNCNPLTATMIFTSHPNCVKNGDINASLAVARRFGSIVKRDRSNRPNPVGRSCSRTICSIGNIFRTCSMLLGDSTPLILCQPRESKHSLDSELEDRSKSSVRNGPTALSINAKCSGLS